MPESVDALTAPGNGQRVVPLRVTVLGADADARRRLTVLLGNTPGVEVVGSAATAHAVAVLEPPSGGRSGVRIDALSLRPDRTVGAGCASAPPSPAAGAARPQLSLRQREVLAAYSAGNELLDVVARGLGMHPETLKTHLRRIRAKYRDAGRPAPTRRDLYVRAVEEGLVPPPG